MEELDRLRESASVIITTFTDLRILFVSWARDGLDQVSSVANRQAKSRLATPRGRG